MRKNNIAPTGEKKFDEILMLLGQKLTNNACFIRLISNEHDQLLTFNLSNLHTTVTASFAENIPQSLNLL